MPSLSVIVVTPDMMRRHRLADVAPYWMRDFCGLIALSLLGAGMASWAIALTSLTLGG